MALLFDPLYPNQVQFVVSNWIWDLYEIHFWQVLFRQFGKTKTFYVLRKRYEEKHYESTALIIMVTVFALSFLIQCLMNWRYRAIEPVVPPAQAPPPQQQINEIADNQNPVNDMDNEVGNQEPDHNQ